MLDMLPGAQGFRAATPRCSARRRASGTAAWPEPGGQRRASRRRDELRAPFVGKRLPHNQVSQADQLVALVDQVDQVGAGQVMILW